MRPFLIKITTRFFLFDVCLLFFLQSPAQPKGEFLQLKLLPVYNRENLIAGKYYSFSEHDSVKIDVLRFYISSLKIFDEDGQCFAEKESYHLLDIQDSSTFIINTLISSREPITKIEFILGVDSLTNANGIGSGDLDPLKGMYWTWQSGYINLKMEGQRKSLSGELNAFLFHLGGFLPPFLACQNVAIPLEKNLSAKNVTLLFDVRKLLLQIDLKKEGKIMSPSARAVEISKSAAESFFIRLK
jgi:hypothetical protein